LYNAYLETGEGSRNPDMTNALQGAIHTLTGFFDFSAGATHWDGIDVITKGSGHFRQWKAAFDPRKGIYDPGDWGSPFYVNCQEYACSYYGVNGKVARSVNTSLGTVSKRKGALWQVTTALGPTIFYKEIAK
jgi:hypothetical protein